MRSVKFFLGLMLERVKREALAEQESTVHQNPGLPFWPQVILKFLLNFHLQAMGLRTTLSSIGLML